MRTDHEIFIEILVLQEQTTIKISLQYKASIIGKGKRKKHLVFNYLVTQINLYSKNLQQTHSLL